MTPLPFTAIAAVTPVVEILEQLGVRYHIGGSLASSAFGMPRSTADVDLVAELQLDHVDAFVSRLDEDYYVDAEAVREAIRLTQSFNLVHFNTMIKIDVFVPEQLPFNRQEQSRARPYSFPGGESRSFALKSPEDLVLRKLLWYRAGGEVSTQQWSDVLGVLKVQAGRLDREYLLHWAAELRVSDLLERALSEASQNRSARR